MSALPEGWAEATLGDVTTQRQEKLDPKAVAAMPFLGMDDVESASGKIVQYKTTDGLKSSVAAFEAGDLLFGRLRPYLKKVVRPEQRGAASAEFIVFEENEGFDLELLKHLLLSEEFLHFTTQVSTGDRPRVSYKSISGFELKVPPAPEQKRIAAKIESLTAKSARARTALAKIEALVERFKAAVLEQELSSIPATSQHCTIEEIAKSIRYGTSKKSEYNLGKSPVLRIPNIVSGSVDISDLKYGDFDEDDFKKLSLRAGDMLFIRSNGSVNLVGRSAVVTGDQAGYLFAGYLIRVRFDLDRVDPSYVQLWFSAPKQRETIERLARSTSGVNNINSKQIQALKITIPPLEVQRSVVQRANARLQLIERLKSECVASRLRLASLDGAVLKRAFEGRLVRQNPADEPAVVLLDRIRLAKQQEGPHRRPRLRLVDVGDHAVARREQMAKTLLEALTNTGDWMDAQSLFSAVGIKSGASTDTIEFFYAELRTLDEDGLIEWEPVLGGDGKKVTDRIRLKEPAKA